MDQGELSTKQVLQREIPWETYMVTKLISATDLQLLRHYDKKPENTRAQLLDEDGPAYVQLFVTILRDIFKEETVEYVLALVYEMLSANPTRARLFHDQSLAHEDTYEPFLSHLALARFVMQTKSYVLFQVAVEGKLVHSREKLQDPWLDNKVLPKAGVIANGEASDSKKHITTIDDVLNGLVEWLCAQSIIGFTILDFECSSGNLFILLVVLQLQSAACPHCLRNLLSDHRLSGRWGEVTCPFNLPSIHSAIYPVINSCDLYALDQQLLYETCLCIWLMSYYEPAIEYLATSRTMQRLTEVVKSSTKEKVVRVVILTFRNLLPKGTFVVQMDLLDALNQLEEGLKDKIWKLSSFDKYKQEVLLGHLEWNPMHKEANFWRENVSSFEENDFQILRVLLTILDTSSDPRSLAVACYDLSQFIQYHAAGRVIVTDLKAKERVMRLMGHENAEVTKNALLCIQRLLLGAKYASFLQV
ncbi:hypothetical protein YC2023_095422 [Brassica napus]